MIRLVAVMSLLPDRVLDAGTRVETMLGRDVLLGPAPFFDAGYWKYVRRDKRTGRK